MDSFFRELLLVTPLSPKIRALKTLLEYYSVTSRQNQVQYENSNKQEHWLLKPPTNKTHKPPTSLSVPCFVVLSVFNCHSHKCKDNTEQPMINWKEHLECKKHRLHVILSVLQTQYNRMLLKADLYNCILLSIYLTHTDTAPYDTTIFSILPRLGEFCAHLSKSG